MSQREDSIPWDKKLGTRLRELAGARVNVVRTEFPPLVATARMAGHGEELSSKNPTPAQIDAARRELLRFYAGGDKDHKTMGVDFQFWLARALYLRDERAIPTEALKSARQRFLDELVKEPADSARKSAVLPPPTALSGSEAWSSSLLATDLMFLKHGNPPPNPKAFYEGWPITTSQLATNCDVPRTFIRNGNTIRYEELLKTRILPQLKEAAARRAVPVFLFTGPGGTGKTTVLERIGYDLVNNKGVNMAVLRVRKESALDAKDVLYDYHTALKDTKARAVALFIDEASAHAGGIRALLESARRGQLQMCCFLAEQTNKREQLPQEVEKYVEEYALGRLTKQEIRDLLLQLEKTDNLGALKEKTAEERLDFFETFADKQLLVALREATTGKRFDVIVQEELKKIPSELGKRLYEATATLHAFGLYLPDEAARRILKCMGELQSWRNARASCREILQSTPARAIGMTTAWRTRHGVIAEIILNTLYGRSLEDANDFAEDAALTLYALRDMETSANQRTVFRIASDFVRHELFAEHICMGTSFHELARAFAEFDEIWNEEHNNFIPAAAQAWRMEGCLEASIGLLKEAIALGNQQCKSLPACCEALAFCLLETRSTERMNEGIELLSKHWQEFQQAGIPSWLIANGLSLLHEFRKADGALASAISVLEDLLSRSGPGDKVRVGLRLCELLVKRGQTPDMERAISIVEGILSATPPLPNRGKAFIRLADLLLARDNAGTETQKTTSLTSAIGVLDKVLATAEDLPDSDALLIHKAKLLQARNAQGDVKKALELVEGELRKEPAPREPTMLLIRLSSLLQAEVEQEGLNTAIRRIREAFAKLGTWPDANMLRVHLSGLLLRRHRQSANERDLNDAITELAMAVGAPQTVQNPARLAVRLCRLLTQHRGKDGLDEAIAVLEGAACKKPFRRSRGWLLFKLSFLVWERNSKGDSDKAVTVLEEAKKCHNSPALANAIDKELGKLGATAG
jgi:DNA polymerase III delta prime subunit